MLDYYRSTAPCPNRKAHDEQKFLRFLKKQLKEFSQNTGKQEMILNTFRKKNVVFFCKNKVRFSYVGGTTPISFPSAKADEEGLTAIRNKNQLR